MKSTEQCSTVEVLTAYLQGRLSSREDAATRRHLEACGTCREALERLAGDARSWREARELLADLDDAGPDADDRLPARQDKREGLRESLRRAGVDAHLSQWMGPTDDPAKMGRVGAFEVVGIIGIGGTGVVLKAHDARLNRYVALKVLLPALAHNAAARRRFERESRAVAAIAHQNVVPIYAVDSHNGLPYIAMQYVGGSSLQQRLDDHGPLHVLAIVRIGAQIARALAAAHAQGVIHRDIKPANVLLEDNIDRVLVADFGLARVVDEASTHSGGVAGTPQYMSPEQCHGEPADRRSDLFSLGSVMYAMCVGHPPFRTETLMGSLRKVCEATPRRLREQNADIPEWLEVFIDRLMQKGRDDRFQDASAVAEILEAELAHLQNPTAVTAPDRAWMQPSKPAPITEVTKRRNRMIVVPMIVVPTALGVALLIALAQGNRNDSTEDSEPTGPGLAAAQRPLNVHRDEDGNAIYEANIDRIFDVQPNGVLAVRAIDGDIKVTGSDSNQVRVRVLRYVKGASSESMARDILGRHNVDFETKAEGDSERKANAVSVRATKQAGPNEPPREAGTLRVVYEIVVPEQFNLMLSNPDGDIFVDGVTGDAGVTSSDGGPGAERGIMAEAHDGDIQMTRCKGTIFAVAPDGNVRLVDCDGTVTAMSAEGTVVLKDCDGTLVAMAKEGRVTADNWSGSLVVRSVNNEKEHVKP